MMDEAASMRTECQLRRQQCVQHGVWSGTWLFRQASTLVRTGQKTGCKEDGGDRLGQGLLHEKMTGPSDEQMLKLLTTPLQAGHLENLGAEGTSKVTIEGIKTCASMFEAVGTVAQRTTVAVAVVS